MPKLPGFVGPSYESQSKMMAGERCVNLVPENIESGGKGPRGLYPAPGLDTFATGDDVGRGLFAEGGGRVFAGQGAKLIEVNSNGTVTDRGALLIDANPVQFADNGNDELLIANGGRGSLLTLSTGVLTASVVADVAMCGVLDTFLIGLDPLTGTMKISESGDGMTWDPAQVVQRSAAADPWVSMLISRRDIYLFGRETGEVWWNAGNAPIPFAQRGGAFFEVGIEAPFSIAPFGSTLAWLGRSKRGSGRVYQMSGYTPVPISTAALEWAIEQYRQTGPIDNAIGWGYEGYGHNFYVLEFPTPGKTWVYDEMTGWWTERGKWDADANDFLAYRARFHADAFGKILCCDSQSGRILNLSTNLYTDVGGSELRRMRRMPHITAEHKLIALDYLELECARGVGAVEGQPGDDPQMILRLSGDGGNTYGNERWASLGERGNYNTNVRWDRGGTARDWVIELSCTDPVPTFMCELYGAFS